MATSTDTLLPLRALAFALALLAPSLLAYNISPSATLLNQLVAIAGWGAVLMQVRAGQGVRQAARQALPLLAALAVLLGSVLWSCETGLPSSLAWQAMALLLAALAVGWAATAAGGGPEDDLGAFASAMLLAGVASALIAMVQVFAPQWADGNWIARSGLPGRAVGNLRQPNHLSSLLLWGLIALVPVAQAGRWFSRRLPGLLALALGAVLVLGVVLSASRTGTVGMVLLALWGAADRRLSRPVRLGLLAAPLVYGAFFFGMAEWAHETARTFGGEARLSEGDLSSSRFGIWSNTLAMIRSQPWTGVGFGEFNLAWSLSPFPGRPVAFFDHTHNLPLQLAVELGLPLAALVMLLLLAGLWLAARRAWQRADSAAPAARAALMMVLMIGVHSLLEYPLWYSYFLLPTAWAWGCALRVPTAAAGAAPAAGRSTLLSWWLGALMVAGAVFAVLDYGKVVAIFTVGDGQTPLAQRIERGQHSLFFAHHADYAAATTTEPPSAAMGAFGTTTHSLLDTRLMVAWARALNESGHRDQARYLVERLREFRNPDAQDFLAACDRPAEAGTPPPFQCEPHEGDIGWRDFMR